MEKRRKGKILGEKNDNTLSVGFDEYYLRVYRFVFYIAPSLVFNKHDFEM